MTSTTKEKPIVSFETIAYKEDAITAAEDLCYGKQVVKNLTNATSIPEIIRIMKTARNQMGD